LVDIGFLEKCNAENLQDFAHSAIDSQLFLDDGNEKVYADRDPNLGLYSILGSAKERLDAQVLFDPFEEKFHLPAALVQLRNCQGREAEVVGQEYKPVVGLCVEVTDTPQWYRILLGRLEAFEDYCLIASQTGRFVDMTRGLPPVVETALCTDHKEYKVLCENIETVEVDVATVHNVESTRFENQDIQDVDVVNLPFRNPYKRWDVAAQIEKCVKFDGSFALPEPGPREEGKTQVDGCGIEDVGDPIQLHTEVVPGIQPPGYTNQHVSEICVDAPISLFVGIGQRALGDPAPDADVVEFGPDGTKTSFDIAEALSVCELCECHAKKLVET
jgi:hypothetical protein